MATVKSWLASAALLGGATGGAAVGLAASGDPAHPASTHSATAVPDASYLRQQINVLVRQDHALKRAVHKAQLRLAGQVHAGEQSLTALHQRIAQAQAQLARAQATTTVVAAPAPASAPATSVPVHTTTGASGAGSGHGEGEGGHDD